MADDSIKYQTLKDIEVIKITDPDISPGEVINIGLDKAQGELITWMYDDDVQMLEKCEILAMYADEYPKCDVFYGGQVIIDEKNKFSTVFTPPQFDIESFITTGNYISSVTTAVRREKIGNVRFRVDYPICDEFIFFYELYQRGARFKRIDVPLVFVRSWLDARTVKNHQAKVREHERMRTEFGDDRFYRNRSYSKKYMKMAHEAEQQGGVARQCPR